MEGGGKNPETTKCPQPVGGLMSSTLDDDTAEERRDVQLQKQAPMSATDGMKKEKPSCRKPVAARLRSREVHEHEDSAPR